MWAKIPRDFPHPKWDPIFQDPVFSSLGIFAHSGKESGEEKVSLEKVGREKWEADDAVVCCLLSLLYGLVLFLCLKMLFNSEEIKFIAEYYTTNYAI